MRIETAPLLETHPVVHSRDAEEARAFLRGKDFHLEMDPRQARDLDFRINGVYLPSLFIGYIQYGPPARIRAGPTRDDYWIQLPMCGRIEVVGGGDSIVCDPGRAAVASPTRTDYYLVQSEAGSTGIRLSLPRRTLTAQLCALLGEPPGTALALAPEMSLTSGYGCRLARYVRMAVDDFGQADAAPWSPVTMSAFEQFITTSLLLSHPSNYTEALRRLEKGIAPRDVKRAFDFMQANLDQPITIADIARASGVPGRTLFQHFRDCWGTSPMRYLRNARFEKVRQILLRGEPAGNVTQIAIGLGFTHMGRFAVEYRQRFGESPSQALRRARRQA
jgi:AraC-like DNA-binding protein